MFGVDETDVRSTQREGDAGIGLAMLFPEGLSDFAVRTATFVDDEGFGFGASGRPFMNDKITASPPIVEQPSQLNNRISIGVFPESRSRYARPPQQRGETTRLGSQRE
jgi:hypothetical protein